MWDVLGFPDKYKVHKKLNKSMFLKSANLTTQERKILDRYLIGIKILYDIDFPDKSEIVVICAEINMENARRFTLNDIINSIVSSVPYSMLLVLKYKERIRLLIFDERENKINPCRSKLTATYSSSSINIADPIRRDRAFINELIDAVDNAKSKDDLKKLWRDIFAKYSYLPQKLAVSKSNNSIYGYFVRDKRSRMFNYLLDEGTKNCMGNANARFDEDDFVDENDEKSNVFEIKKRSDIFSGNALIPKDEMEDALFLKFCCRNIKPIYMEYLFEHALNAEDIEDEEWLKAYMEACNDYAQNVFVKSLDSDSVIAIKDAFYSDAADTGYEISEYSYFDLDALKEYLYDNLKEY